MNFLQTLKSNIYSPKFYKGLLKTPFKESFLYFLLLALLLTTLHLITFAGSLLIDAPREAQKFVKEVVNCYPNDLEIKITNGIASSSAQEPYIIPSCEALEGSNESIVIDTKTPFSPEKFKEYNAAVWVTKDSVVYKKNDYETRSNSFAQIKDFTLNKEVINSYYNTFSPWLNFIGPILLILSFIGIYIAYDFRLIYLLFFAALLLILNRLFKYNLTFGQAYKVGLHAVTLGLIVELVIDITSRWTNFHGFPFMFTFITLGVVVINLFLPKQGHGQQKS